VPTHPGTVGSNRRPTRAEIAGGLPFVELLARGRRTLAVGRVAESVLDADYVRHPSHGGAEAFRAGLAASVRDPLSCYHAPPADAQSAAFT
jgi:hypothetical protein